VTHGGDSRPAVAATREAALSSRVGSSEALYTKLSPGPGRSAAEVAVHQRARIHRAMVDSTDVFLLRVASDLRTTQLQATPATDSQARVGLIEQSTRAAGNGFPIRSTSTRPAGPTPAGVTTQEELT
jgi:hypothetical protein